MKDGADKASDAPGATAPVQQVSATAATAKDTIDVEAKTKA